jgi:threonine/homoserine/homoserine lactone efflux protein
MAFDTWLMYLLAVIAVCITPGPNILLAMTHSVQHGLKRTSVTALGCITSTSTMAIISATGLGAVLLASERAFIVLKWLGGAYLFYMGLSLWLKKDSQLELGPNSEGNETSLKKLYQKGVLVSASNPKAMVFFGALFPVFIDTKAALLPQFSIMLMTFLVFSYGFIMAYAAVTSRLAPFLRRQEVAKSFNRITGGLFMGLGAMLATSEK